MARHGLSWRDSSVFLPTVAQFTARTGVTPTWYTRCTEQGGRLVDLAGSAHVAQDSTAPIFQQWATLTVGGEERHYRGHYIDTNSVTKGWNADVNNFGTSSFLMGCWFSCNSTDAGDRPIMGRYSSTIYAFTSVNDSGGGGDANRAQLLVNDGTRSQTVTLDKVVTDGVPRLLMWQYDVTADTVKGYIVTPGEAATTVTGASIASYTTLAGGATPKFVVGQLSGVQYGLGHWFGGMFVVIGAGAEGTSAFTNIAAGLGAI